MGGGYHPLMAHPSLSPFTPPHLIPQSLSLIPHSYHTRLCHVRSGHALSRHVYSCHTTQTFTPFVHFHMRCAHQASYIYTYKLTGEGERRTTLTLVHKTAVEGVPAALHGFNGRLLAGVGKVLRLYVQSARRP